MQILDKLEDLFYFFFFSFVVNHTIHQPSYFFYYLLSNSYLMSREKLTQCQPQIQYICYICILYICYKFTTFATQYQNQKSLMRKLGRGINATSVISIWVCKIYNTVHWPFCKIYNKCTTAQKICHWISLFKNTFSSNL